MRISIAVQLGLLVLLPALLGVAALAIATVSSADLLTRPARSANSLRSGSLLMISLSVSST
jgi:hypothetical protein